MKIALVSPPSPFLINQKVFPPLSLLTLSSVMKQNGFNNIQFLDLAGKNTVPETHADIFFFTATTPQIDYAEKVAIQLKKQNPTAKFVIGGSHATLSHIIPYVFDIVVKGEGENAVLNILHDFPNNNRVYIGKKIQNLDLIPFPDRDIIDIKEYANNYKLNGEPTTTYISAYGCSYGRCAFCCRTTKGVRYRSAKNLYKEIKLVKERYGIRGAMIFDDEFTANHERLIEFCNLIKNEDIEWRCFSRVTSINNEIAKIMKTAGCVEVAVGIESADEQILKNITKGIKIEHAKQCVKILKKNGIRVKELFIIGLPGEHKGSIQKIDKFVAETEPDDVDFTILCVYPGCNIYKHPDRYDIRFNPTCRSWYKGIKGNYDKVCPIRTSRMDFKEILNARDMLEQKYKRWLS